MKMTHQGKMENSALLSQSIASLKKGCASPDNVLRFYDVLSERVISENRDVSAKDDWFVTYNSREK